MTRQPTLRWDDLDSDNLLGELILYVSDKCAGDDMFGATKLNKILWWSDFIAYEKYGRPITGAEYMRLGRGPAPRRLVPVRQALVEAGDATVRRDQRLIGYTQDRVVPLRSPNLDLFTGSQISLVDQVIELTWGKSATSVSHMSHGKAWAIPSDRGTIPYEAVFLSDAPVDEYDLIRTRELVAQLDLQL